MPFKVILNANPETGEVDDFLWAKKEKPSPLVRPKIKPKKGESNNKSSKRENKS